MSFTFTLVHTTCACPAVGTHMHACTNIYLVRHGGGAHFVFHYGLGEVVEAHVGPHVAAEVGENRVDASHAVAVGRYVIVVRDLM